MIKFVYLIVVINFLAIGLVNGHARLLDPVSRGSLWRYDNRAPANYNDNQLFCGGFWRQHGKNKGRCGLCGDAFDEQQPRQHEIGGKYGSGRIVAVYRQGSAIKIGVEITSNHRGEFRYDICNIDKHGKESEQCFGENRLKMPNGEHKYILPNYDSGWHNCTVQLPKNLNCQNCVLRWRYRTGNSWGVCPNGSGALGCGQQENFYGCSDIRIQASHFAPKYFDKLAVMSQQLEGFSPFIDAPIIHNRSAPAESIDLFDETSDDGINLDGMQDSYEN